MELNVIIIEDEIKASNHLKNLLQKVDPSLKILAVLSSVSESVKWLKSNMEPELILMDIHLSDGLSFDILEEVDLKCPIIYTTAYDAYAIQAFKTTGIDYLLKPITLDELKTALEKYGQLHQEHMITRYLANAHLFQKDQKIEYKKRFLLKIGNKMIPILAENIVCFYREDIVFATTKAGETYTIDYSLNQIQEYVNPNEFVRVNRKLIVNINSIVKLQSYKPGQYKIEITPPFHEEILLSQERSSALKSLLS